MLHSNFRWILCFLKKGRSCVHAIFHYLVSKLSSFLNRECERSPMSEGCWEEIIGFSTLLLTIPIFLLRIQKGKCLKNKTLCSWLILWYLGRLTCTIFWGTDWLYYFGITKVSNFEVFPFMPERLGSSVRCLSVWRYLYWKASWEEKCSTDGSYFGKLGEDANATFSSLMGSG